MTLYRVEYAYWCAGGRLRPTERTVEATSPTDALERIRRLDRDAYVTHATVEVVESDRGDRP